MEGEGKEGLGLDLDLGLAWIVWVLYMGVLAGWQFAASGGRWRCDVFGDVEGGEGKNPKSGGKDFKKLKKTV